MGIWQSPRLALRHYTLSERSNYDMSDKASLTLHSYKSISVSTKSSRPSFSMAKADFLREKEVLDMQN